MSNEPAVVLILLLPFAGFLSTEAVGRRLPRRPRTFAIPVRVIDSLANAGGRLTVGTGDRLRVVQSGRVQIYARGIALGLVAMVGAFLVTVGR